VSHGNCITCAYFERDADSEEDADKGTCRRNPPGVAYDPEEGIGLTVWPLVDFLDWCGEHREQTN
jgi:hypothetical protein